MPSTTKISQGPAGPALAALLSGPLPRFLAVGLAGLATDGAVYAALARSGSPDWIGRACSLAVATLVTWQLNRRFTFGASGRRAGHEAARYLAVALGAQGFNYCLFLALRIALPQAPALAILCVSAACAACFSFVGQRSLTFSRTGAIPRPDRSPR